MKQINFDEIIKNAEKRRAGIQQVTDMYADVQYHLGMLRQVVEFSKKLGTAYTALDAEGRNLVCAALVSGTRFGTGVAHDTLAQLVQANARTVSDVDARLALVNDAVNAKG